MSNLIPEQRVDKNGKVVTRHVRLNSKPSGTKAAIPSPSISDARKEHVESLLNVVVHTTQTLAQKIQINKAANSLTDEDIDFAKAFVNQATSYNGRKTRGIAVRQILQSGRGCSRKLRTTDLITREAGMPAILVASFLNTLSEDSNYGDSVYSLNEASEETQGKVCALARTVSRMTKLSELYEREGGTTDWRPMAENNGQSIIFSQPELFEIMLRHPERSMEILDWHRKRSDINAIGELLNSVPALGDGAL